MKQVWLSWAAIGLVLEAYALFVGVDTLSATWRWAQQVLPTWVAVLMSMALGGLFAWLMSVHWLFAGVDRPGLDSIEKLSIIAGLAIGLVGGVVTGRKFDQEEEEA